MASETITLVLNGEVRFIDFVKSESGLSALIRSLAAEVTPGTKIEWFVESLEAGSAITTVRGVPQNGDGREVVDQVARAYIAVGQALERNEPVPFSVRVQKQARTLTTVLRRSVESIRFETADDDAIVTLPPPTARQKRAAPVQVRAPSERGAYGAVEGRVQTLSNRGGLRFTLYDSLYDRAVSCYLVEGREDVMRDAWGKRAVVEGWVSRDPVTGRAQTVRRVSGVTVLPEGGADDYQAARGVITVRSPDMAPELVIRRLRDG